MKALKSLLTIGLVVLAVAQAEEQVQTSKDKTTLATVRSSHTFLEPHFSFPSQPDVKTVALPNLLQDTFTYHARAEVLPTTQTALPDHPVPFPNGPAGFTHNTRDTDNAAEPLPDRPVPFPNGPAGFIHHARDNNIDAVSKTTATALPDRPVPFPNGPVGFTHPARDKTDNTATPLPGHPVPFPNGPAGYNSHSLTQETHPHLHQIQDTSHNDHRTTDYPIPAPNGPAGFTPIHNPPTLLNPRANPWSTHCTGPNLTTKVRTCSSGSKNTDLDGNWCAANCHCSKFGCMTCDAKKAPGCSAAVLTSTCRAVVRDWSCYCVSWDGRESHC